MTHCQAVMWLTGPAMCFCLLLPTYSINVFLHVSGSLYLIFAHVLANINISYLTCVLLKKKDIRVFSMCFLNSNYKSKGICIYLIKYIKNYIYK
jgi:hypothetical protein